MAVKRAAGHGTARQLENMAIISLCGLTYAEETVAPECRRISRKTLANDRTRLLNPIDRSPCKGRLDPSSQPPLFKGPTSPVASP